jgi:hypothetical protein
MRSIPPTTVAESKRGCVGARPCRRRDAELRPREAPLAKPADEHRRLEQHEGALGAKKVLSQGGRETGGDGPRRGHVETHVRWSERLSDDVHERLLPPTNPRSEEKWLSMRRVRRCQPLAARACSERRTHRPSRPRARARYPRDSTVARAPGDSTRTSRTEPPVLVVVFRMRRHRQQHGVARAMQRDRYVEARQSAESTRST